MKNIQVNAIGTLSKNLLGKHYVNLTRYKITTWRDLNHGAASHFKRLRHLARKIGTNDSEQRELASHLEIKVVRLVRYLCHSCARRTSANGTQNSAIITIFLSCATVSPRPCSRANAGWTPFARDKFLVAREARVYSAYASCRAWSYAIVQWWSARAGGAVWTCGGAVRRSGPGPAADGAGGGRELSGGNGSGSGARRFRPAAGPMSAAGCARRRLFYGYLRELPAPRAKGPREASAGRSPPARWGRRSRAARPPPRPSHGQLHSQHQDDQPYQGLRQQTPETVHPGRIQPGPSLYPFRVVVGGNLVFQAWDRCWTMGESLPAPGALRTVRML